jgi:cytochrome b561
MILGYSAAQKFLHWMTVLLLVMQWWTSRAVLRTHEIHLIGHKTDPFDLTLHKFHIYGGIAVFALTVCRILLSLCQGSPALPIVVPRWSAIAASTAHLIIYGILFGLTLTGLITTYIWFGMGVVHRALVYALYLLIAAHVGAVFWHDVFHRAGLLQRMTTRRSK